MEVYLIRRTTDRAYFRGLVSPAPGQMAPLFQTGNGNIDCFESREFAEKALENLAQMGLDMREHVEIVGFDEMIRIIQ